MQAGFTKVYFAESKDGRIKLTTDKDCIAPDAFRVTHQLIPTAHLESALMAQKDAFERRRFRVCIDTQEIFYETNN